MIHAHILLAYDTAFVRDLVTCLGKLLLAQEVSSGVWSSPGTLKTFYVLLSCFREKCVRAFFS